MHVFPRRPAIVLFVCICAQSASAQPIVKAESAFVAARYAEAEALLEPLVATGKIDPEAAYLLGRTRLATRDINGAVQWLARAVEGADSTVRYHVWLGKALAEQARAASVFRQPSIAGESRKHLERAVALAPENIEAGKALAEWYAVAPAMFGGGKPRAREQAAEVGRRNTYEGRLVMAWVLNDGNDPKGAEQQLLAARREYPDSVAVIRALATLYVFRLDRGADGVRLERELLEHQPTMPNRFFLARAQIVAKVDLDSAASGLRTYLTYAFRYGEPTHAAAHYWIGETYLKRGDEVAARQSYEQALRLDPGLVPAKTALEGLK